MQRVKTRNVVLFHSCAHVFLAAQQSCYHLTKGNVEITWKVGDAWRYGRLHTVCVRCTMRSQGSMLPLALCRVSRAQPRLRALLCSQQAGSRAWNGSRALLQRLLTRLSRPMLHSWWSVEVFYWLVKTKLESCQYYQAVWKGPWHFGEITAK